MSLPVISTQTTVIHRLHPLTKIGCATGITSLALAINKPMTLALLLAATVVAMFLARVRVAPSAILAILSMCGVVAAGGFWASRDASEAARYAVRLAVVVCTIPFAASTTAPQDLVRALSRLHIPQGLLIAVLVAWRFFPVIGGHLREIREARLLRGSSDIGSFHRHFLLPLVVAVIEHADRVALALEARGFDIQVERTWLRVPAFGVPDVLFCLATVAVLGAATYLQWGYA